MHVRFSSNRWRLSLVTIATALAMAITLSGPFAGRALASSSQPGEWPYWVGEQAGGNNLYTSSTYSEARDTYGNLLQVWRADDNTGKVWLAYNNGSPFTLGNTQTNVAPSVVPYGPSSWFVFHVGTNNNIYYTEVYDTPSGVTWDGNWFNIPYQTTTNQVAPVQLGYGSTQLYVAYRSSSHCGCGPDNVIWGTKYNFAWSGAIDTGGRSYDGPAATYNPVSGTVYIAATGTDWDVWTSQNGMTANGTWYPLDVTSYMTPAIASCANGYMLVNYIDSSNHPWYRRYNSGAYPVNSFTQDVTGWQTPTNVSLSVVNASSGGSVYAELTGYNGQAYYKQAMTC
jgi:hypothetical protein